MAQPSTLVVTDILAESPDFVTPAQVLEDIEFYETLLRDNYARFEIFAQNGLDWENLFFNLKAQLTTENRQILTRNFVDHLIETISITQDPTFQGEITFRRRIYSSSQTNQYLISYTKLRLAKQGNRLRALPNVVDSHIANQWFLHCDEKDYRLLPVVAERFGEERFVLGALGHPALTQLTCAFEDGLNQPYTAALPLEHFPQAPASDHNTFFTWTPGEIPYIRWLRDGRPDESDTARFFSLTSQLNKRRAFILDVRGNQTGSFGFIERWLRPLTKASWQNTIVQEKQSLSTLEGLLNQLEYHRVQAEISQREALDKEQQRMRALMLYVEKLNVPFRIVETRFSFLGDREALPWNKRMVVVVNQHCGDGCQFLAALAKQLENSFLVGENTGNYPKAALLPMYQLPHSKMRVTINHRLLLDHAGVPVPPSGYEPDFWLDHPSALSEIYRLARSP